MFVYIILVPSGLLSGNLLGSLYILFICNFSYFPFWFSTSESGLWVLIALVPGHCIRLLLIFDCTTHTCIHILDHPVFL